MSTNVNTQMLEASTSYLRKPYMDYPVYGGQFEELLINTILKHASFLAEDFDGELTASQKSELVQIFKIYDFLPEMIALASKWEADKAAANNC